LRVLQSITFVYDAKEDRVLAAINAGKAEPWSCWLTRRVSLAVLQRAGGFLASTSTLAKRVTSEARGELAAFERDAAIAKTAPAMSSTPPAVIKANVGAAELVQRLNFSQQGERFRMEVQGEEGGGAQAMVTRAELQRILQMLEIEVGKAAWTSVPAAPAAAPAESAAPKPFRH